MELPALRCGGWDPQEHAGLNIGETESHAVFVELEVSQGSLSPPRLHLDQPDRGPVG